MAAMTIQGLRRRRTAPVVLVGGIAQRDRGWDGWVRDLSARGIPWAIARVPAGGFASRQAYLDAIEGARAAVLRRHGMSADTPVSIVGFSAGGVAAVDYLRRNPASVGRVVTVSSPLGGNELASMAELAMGGLVPRWVRDLAATASPVRHMSADLLTRVTSITGGPFDGVVTAHSGAHDAIDVIDAAELGEAGRFHPEMQTAVPEVRRAAWAALGIA